ncbi:MAG: HEPN domain-containing protein [Endomicrobium sp.]|jgi:HEPN domain-containing protein|nr:HEPN domain-containing protein [Endomicrobium sp.]
MMTKEELINYWVKSSDMDFETMEFLFSSKRYNWSLFMGHLMIEKLLKAVFVKNNPDGTSTPRIHDLPYLAEKAKLTLTDEKESDLEMITSFQINARYEDFKFSFYKRCTKEYTTEKINKIRGIRIWLKSLV